MAHNRKKPKGTKNARLAAKRAERLRNIGPDASGNYGVNPYAARGHVVEIAPKELRDNPNSTQFPKRIATQRMIDRYLAHGHISDAEWKAAETVLCAWMDSGLEARVIGRYENDVPHGMRTHGDFLGDRYDGVATFSRLLNVVPVRSRGVVRAVVIEDMAASAWARQWGYGKRASEVHGLRRLTQGLRALAQHLGT